MRNSAVTYFIQWQREELRYDTLAIPKRFSHALTACENAFLKKIATLIKGRGSNMLQFGRPVCYQLKRKSTRKIRWWFVISKQWQGIRTVGLRRVISGKWNSFTRAQTSVKGDSGCRVGVDVSHGTKDQYPGAPIGAILFWPCVQIGIAQMFSA